MQNANICEPGGRWGLVSVLTFTYTFLKGPGKKKGYRNGQEL